MKFRMTMIVGALMLAAASAGAVQAQTRSLHLGPRMSYHFDLEEVGLGVQLGVPIANHLEFYPSFDYFFVDVGSFVNFNADLKLRIAHESLEWLYIGGGLNVARTSVGRFDDTRTGGNLFFGAESLRGRVHPFGEFRVVLNDNRSTVLGAIGLNFTLGNHR